MTKKDFFRILIKTFGLYSLIIALFTVLPANLSFIIYDTEYAGIILLLAILAFIIFIFLFLIRKPDTIIKVLRLDSGFDEDRIQFENLNIQSIVKIAAILIGGFLMLNNIPTFLNYAYFAFKKDIARQAFTDQEYINWGTSLLNLVIGYLLITNFEKIGLWFSRNKG